MIQGALVERPNYAARALRPSSTRSAGRYEVPSQPVEQAFHAILGRWLRETKFLSDPEAITSHPAFSELVRLAPRVLPEIETQLRRGPTTLVWALEDAFDRRPYASDDIVGDLEAMTTSWVVWFERARDDIAR